MKCLAQPRRQLKPIEGGGQIEVGEQNIWCERPGICQRQRRRPIRRDCNMMALVLQKQLQKRAHLRIILDDKHCSCPMGGFNGVDVLAVGAPFRLPRGLNGRERHFDGEDRAFAGFRADAHLVAEQFPKALNDGVGGMARRHPQIAVSRPHGIDALGFAIDQHRRWRIAIQHQAAAQFGQRRRTRWRNALTGARRRPHAVPGGYADVARAAAPDIPVDPHRLGDHFKTAIDMARGFRAAQHQKAVLAQGKMKPRDDFGLRFGAEVDQEIAAGDQIEPRKRRIGDDIMNGEDHRGAKLRRNLVAVIALGKEPRQPVRRNIRDNAAAIASFPRGGDGVRIDIGGEDLELHIALCCRDMLAKQHGERIGFLAGAASGHPDAQRAGPASGGG